MRTEIIERDGVRFLKLPPEIVISSDTVEIIPTGSSFLISNVRESRSAVAIYDALVGMPDDFFAEGRHDPPPEDVPSWDD